MTDASTGPATGPATDMDWKLELILLPVANPDRSKAFYVDTLGFNLDVDHDMGDFRVIQCTPRGSSCSITFGVGMPVGEPGSVKGTHLVVEDIEAALAFLDERGVEHGGIVHFEDGGPQPGPDPERRDYNSFIYFDDPDGNSWAVQEVHHQAR